MDLTIQDGSVTQRERKGSGQPQQGGASRPSTAAPPPTPQSKEKILSDIKARIAARLERARQKPDTGLIGVIVVLLEEKAFLTGALEELNSNRDWYPDARRAIAETEAEIKQNEVNLNSFLNPQREEGESETDFEGRKHQLLLSVEEARRVVGWHNAARVQIDVIRAIESPNAMTINDVLKEIGPFVADVPKDSPNYVTTWGNRHLGSAMPHDEIVSGVPKAFGEMVTKFTTRKEKEDDDVVQLLDHAGYFISDDQVDALRKSGQSVNLTRFLGNGEGNYSIISYRFGESLVLERRTDGKVYPFKASGPKIGRMAFLFRDRQTNRFKEVERDRLRAIENDGTNVSKVWHDDLREALEFQLRREAENAERQEVSKEIRNVSGLKDPITSYDLVAGKVGICVMDYGFRQGDRFIKIPPYRLASDGTHVWVSDSAPGSLEKADPGKTWLLRQVKQGQPSLLDPNNPLPISELRKLREWKEASRANGHSEAHWQTERHSATVGATVTSRENLNGLVSVGGDGVDRTTYSLYSFTTTVRRRNQGGNVFWVTGGFIVERAGSTVKLLWATPNVASEARRMGLGEKTEEITNLPSTFRDVFRSLYLGVNNLRGENGWKQAPAHLQREAKSDDSTQEETEE